MPWLQESLRTLQTSSTETEADLRGKLEQLQRQLEQTKTQSSTALKAEQARTQRLQEESNAEVVAAWTKVEELEVRNQGPTPTAAAVWSRSCLDSRLRGATACVPFGESVSPAVSLLFLYLLLHLL